MDALVTYVNGLDPLWREDYERTVGKSLLEKRFRDWGTLRYLFRGIEAFMPFIDRIHLVVARESQVPEWVDRAAVNVVLHSDIMPADKLPTFNSSMIEMFLHRTPSLSERFIYFNDDIFPVAQCSETDFFENGKPVKRFSRNLLYFGKFRNMTKHCDALTRKVLGMKPSPWYVRPQHTVSPMLKSECESMFSKAETEIMASLSPLRNKDDLNQYLFLDYIYYQGKAVNRRISNRHFSLAAHSIESVCSFLRHPTEKLVCINDVSMPNDKYLNYRKLLLDTFESILPEKSKYEI